MNEKQHVENESEPECEGKYKFCKEHSVLLFMLWQFIKNTMFHVKKDTIQCIPGASDLVASH